MPVPRRNGALAALVTGRDSDNLTVVAVGQYGRLVDAQCSIIRPPKDIPSSSAAKGERLQLPDITGPSPLTIWNEGKFKPTPSDTAHPVSALAMYSAAKDLNSEPILVYQDGAGSIVSRTLTSSGWDNRAYCHFETRHLLLTSLDFKPLYWCRRLEILDRILGLH